MIERRFNLIDEGWIPVVGRGRVGLKTIFIDSTITALGGNPVEKVALFKLLLAIAQSAYTPKDETDWKQLGCEGMQKKVLDYLDEHHDLFWLYGEKPFLQMSEIEKICHEKLDKNKKKQPVKIGNGTFPDLFPDNNTIVSQYDYADISGSDADKALFLITTENFAFYGKQIDKEICLEKNYEKGCIAKPGPSLGFNNYLHTFVFLDTILSSLYINLITEAVLTDNPIIGQTVGIPFWEKMPQTEKCEIARKSKLTLIGHLVPLSRYMLFIDDGVYFTEGIQYQYSKADKKTGKAEADWIEPSFSWKWVNKGELKGIYADVSKKPWRILDSLLVNKLSEMEYTNIGLKLVLGRIEDEAKIRIFSIWSGGLDVSGDSFGKKIKEADDFVESEVQISAAIFFNGEEKAFFDLLSTEMEYMRDRESELSDAISNYYMSLTGKGNKKTNFRRWKFVSDKETPLPKQQYWQLCESRFQQLVDACFEDSSGEKARDMRKIFSSFVYQIYDRTCPKDTARQIEAWAENRPFGNKQEEKQSDE